jgi:hypothetical protein
VELLTNPDPHRGRYEMLHSMVVRDARMFGPVLEVRRQIQCILGRPQVMIYDQVINRGDAPVPHAWLYHVNFGYPLLDRGARFVYRGPAEYWQVPKPPDARSIMRPLDAGGMNKLKRVPDSLPEHASSGERGLIVENAPDADGLCRAGLINDRLRLAVELEYPAEALPRLANWQHYGPRGCYVTGIEPFTGSLMGTQNDRHPSARQVLQPGETRRYQLTLRVHSGAASIRELAGHDGPVTARG